jgi:hypothetical protein
MLLAKDGGHTIFESHVDYQRFFANPTFIHYVGMLNPPRHGFADCLSLLEHTYYKPGSDRNHLYQLRILDWMGVVWGIVSIPIQEKENMERVAQANHLRVADGIPTMFDSTGTHRFPVSNERVFTMENTPGHPVYKNRSI